MFSLQKQEKCLKKVQKKAAEEKICACTFNIVTKTNEVDKNSEDLLDIYHLN